MVLRNLILFLVLSTATSMASAADKVAVVLEIEGAIGPVTAGYIDRGLAAAQELDAALVVIKMDTPGGLDASMRTIIRDILASQVPVATFVYPSGSRAASAGTYILYASHVAAMAPATNLGSATPVQIGGLGFPDEKGEPQADKGKQKDTGRGDTAEGEPTDDTEGTDATEPAGGSAMERKTVNDAVGYIRGLAKLRGRNAEWAEKAVREAANLDAEEALELDVIDLIARSVPDLLAELDGWTVRVLGEERTLDTDGIALEVIEPDWRTKILAAITNPNVAYILMLIGVYGLIYELASPGAIFPGVIGGISLILALFAFQALPVNYAGLALLGLGIAFMVGEALVPSFGILGIGGLVAFVIGSVILFQDESGQFGVAVPLIAAFAVASALIFIGVIGLAVRTRKRPVVSGSEQLVGAVGRALDTFISEGWVHLHGETWQARTQRPVVKGQSVRILRLDGLMLIVEPIDEET